MTTVPFELHIKNVFPKQTDRVVICTELLRQVPGKRSVYKGLLDDKPVTAKIYEKKFLAGSRLHEEWSKINRLA